MTITISLISLTVSILSVRVKKPLFLNVDPIEWNDSFEMLYEESKFMFRCANYSGQDMLLHLKEGYVFVKNRELNTYEIHSIQEQYYTLKACSLSEIPINIDVRIHENGSRYKNKVYLRFEYNDGIRRRKLICKQKNENS